MAQSVSTRAASNGRKLWVAGAVATIAAVLGNVVVYLIANAVAGPISAPNPAGEGDIPIHIAAPIILTTLGIVGATVVFGIVKRRSAQPVRTFVTIALVVLAASYLVFLLPLGMPGVTIFVLGLMHLVAAAIGVPILLWLAK